MSVQSDQNSRLLQDSIVPEAANLANSCFEALDTERMFYYNDYKDLVKSFGAYSH